MKTSLRQTLDVTLRGAGGLVMIGSLLACLNNPIRQPDAYTAQPNSSTGRTTNGATSRPGDPTRAPAANADPDQARCEQQNAQACVNLGKRSLAKSDRNVNMAVRALQAYFQACELGRGDACYAYGLMNWQGLGSDYNPEEISYGLGRADELGYERARVDFQQLLDPNARDSDANPSTLYHLKQACELGMARACSLFKLQTDGRVVKLPTPRAPGLPLPASADKPATPTTPAIAPKPAVVKSPATPTPSVTPTPPARPAANPSAALAPQQRLRVLEDRGIQVDGPLSLSAVLSSLEPRRSQLVFCYERALSRQPGLKGSMTLRMKINAAGFVSNLSIQNNKLGSPDATRCISELVGLWQFAPRPGDSTLEYSISFGVKY